MMTLKKVFLHSIILMGMLAGNLSPAMANNFGTLSILSDDFDRPNLGNPFRWDFVNPLGDGWVAIVGANTGDAHLELSIPGGQSHEPWSDNASVRIMQPALDTDIEIETKFVSEPTTGIQIQGMLVEQDDNNWLRFDLRHNGAGLRVLAATTIDGSTSSRFDKSVGSGAARFLRITRSGDFWTMKYSPDGSTWTTAGSFSHSIAVHAAGIFVANQSGSGEIPAYTAIADYFRNTAEKIAPEDGATQIDVLAPFIHTIQEVPGADSATITWHTDEPSWDTIEYGTTPNYGSSKPVSGGSTFHSATLTNLEPGQTYHYRILSTDSFNQSSVTKDFEFRIEQSSDIDIWYGQDQTFGQIGQTQPWVNILGELPNYDGNTTLEYSLNGGTPVPLSIGQDFRRLSAAGDFNIDLATAKLLVGDNSVVITATDNLNNQATQAVTVSYQTGNVWPQPYAIDWSTVASDGNPLTPDESIQSVAQVVDGKWSVDGDTVRTVEPGYDRLIAIGDVSWDDYEVTVPITIHAITNSTFGVGLLFGWNGHTDDPVVCDQPKCGWIPYGAIGWMREDGIEFFVTSARKTMPITTGTTYWMKMRVETGAYSAQYRLKVWEHGNPEPGAWDLTYTDLLDPVINGSMMLLTHMADTSFGNVTITPLDGAPNVSPIAYSDSAYVALGGTTDIPVLNNDVDSDGYLVPATLNIHNQPTNGTITVNPSTGLVNYVHVGSTTDSDHFSYTVDDNEGATSNEITVTVMVIPTGAASLISDDFNSCSLNPMWTFVDPVGDSSYDLVGALTECTHLAITVPQGIEHQLWTTGPNAARMMQPALDDDFEIEVKFDSPLTLQYQEQGIVVEGTGGTFLRMEFYSSASETVYLYAAIFEDNTNLVYSAGNVLTSGLPSYMRLTRVGDVWTQSASFDGITWKANTNFVDFTYPMTVTHVGVYAGNAISISSPEHTALVDYFRNNAQVSYNVDITVVGSGSVDRDPAGPYYYLDKVQLTAIPDQGWVFDSWSGDLISTTNPVTLTFDANKAITATFTPIEYTVDISVVGSGSVEASPAGPYYYNDQIQLAANSDPGWFFSSWSGDLISTTNPITLTIDGSKTITATFLMEEPGTITVIKQTQPAGESQVFDFTASYTNTFQLADGQSHTSNLLDPGVYSVSENPTPGWLLTGATCDDGSDPGNIQLDSAENVTCTFVNEPASHTVYVPLILNGASQNASGMEAPPAGQLVSVSLFQTVVSLFLQVVSRLFA